MSVKIHRSDRCHLVGKRAIMLTDRQAAAAWRHLGHTLRDTMGSPDPGKLPKFKALIGGIRSATIAARRIR